MTQTLFFYAPAYTIDDPGSASRNLGEFADVRAMARRRLSQASDIDANLGKEYPSRPKQSGRRTKSKQRLQKRVGMDLLTTKFAVMSGWSKGDRQEHETKSIAESFRAINDVIEVAAAVDDASICILCSTLSSPVREAAWRKHTGITFADQLRKVLVRNATVHILVYGDQDSVFPVAPSIISLLGEFGNGPSKRMQITLTGTGEYVKKAFGDFPHFTMSTVKGDKQTETFAHVEWEHPDAQVDWANGGSTFRGMVFAAKDEANEPLGFIRRRFDHMFKALSKTALAS